MPSAGDLISVNEELSRVIGRYKLLVEGKAKLVAKASSNRQSNSNNIARPQENGLLFSNNTSKDDLETTGSVTTPSDGADMLLDLSTPTKEKPVSSVTADLINQELNVLG